MVERSDGNALRSVLKFAISGRVAWGESTVQRRAASTPVWLIVAALTLCAATSEIALTPAASAQIFPYNALPPKPVTQRPANDGQMLVQANQVDYDYNNSRVAAVGNVQLFYNGTSVEADKVIYDQKTKRLHAEGNIRMTDVDGKPGDHQFRGGLETKGEFAISDKWVWGWEGVALSDYMLLSDYRLSVYKDAFSSFLALPTGAPSQIFLTGVGNRSYFDARTIYYESLSGAQSQVPVVWPVVDYSNVINHQVLGGEVSYKTNFTNLTRSDAVFDPITAAPAANGSCILNSADSAQSITKQNCLMRGMPGTYTRFSAEADWRRSFTDSAGEIWTPFASIRADAINADITNQPGVSSFLPVGDTTALRVMPTIGLEYRYPFINVQPWGSTTIEPIAQVIIRPNESYAGKLPNEDSQSMTFDTFNFLSINKFSGYDRVEGGGRANAGVQATTQFDRGGSVTAVFGQSYQLFGLNSFAVQDVTNTAVDSGLQTPKSDYVASLSYSPNRTYTLATRARLDEATGSVQRFEAEAKANFDRWSVSLLYGDYAPQPDLGYMTRREGVLVSGSVKIADNLVATGAARWDLVANQINQYGVGAGYVDDFFVLAANYVTSFSYATTTSPPILGHAFMLQIGLRTIGTVNIPIP